MSWARLVLAAQLLWLLTGCASSGTSPSAPSRAESLKLMDPALIQSDTMGFADRFVTTMTGVYQVLEQRAPAQAAKDAAHQLKTDLALGAVSNAVNSRPIAGLMDMVVLVTLLRQIAEDPWAVQTFGGDSVHLADALKRQEADIQTMASRYLTDAQLHELDELAVLWHQTHPGQQAVSHVHLADLPEANRSPRARGNGASSVFGLIFFDPTANLHPAVREIELSRATSERMFFYLQRLPLLLQLQSESFYRQMLQAPEFKQVLGDMSVVAASTKRFSGESARFTDTVGKFPQQLSEERQQAVRQLSAEVALQRDASVQQLSAAVRQEQQSFVSNLEAATNRSLNRMVVNLALAALMLAALAVAGMILYRHYRRRGVRVAGSNFPPELAASEKRVNSNGSTYAAVLK